MTSQAAVFTPTAVAETTLEAAHASVWRRMDTSDTHSCALHNSGRLYCWGSNESGEAGRSGSGTGVTVATPSAISDTSTDWTDVSAGVGYTCAIKEMSDPETNQLWRWGDNSMGQLGTGSETAEDESLSPTPASSEAPARVGSTIDWDHVDVGAEQTCGVDTGSRFHCWGTNDDGQTGTGEFGAVAYTPQRVIDAALRR